MIYLSNDCMQVDVYLNKKEIYDFPLNMGVLKKDDYIKLMKNIDTVDFNNIDFFIKNDHNFEPHTGDKYEPYIIGNIDNCFEYYFVHDYHRGFDIDTTKSRYFRRIERWDGNRDNFIFSFKNVQRPFDKLSAEDVYEIMNTPCRQKKQLILGGNPDWTINDIDISKLNEDVKVLNVNYDFPWGYVPELMNRNEIL